MDAYYDIDIPSFTGEDSGTEEGEVDCTVVGVIETGGSTTFYYEYAITFSVTALNTNLTSQNCNSDSLQPDWAGPATNPFGKWPNGNGPHYLESRQWMESTHSSNPWTWVAATGTWPKVPTVVKAWTGANLQPCTNAYKGIYPAWQ